MALPPAAMLALATGQGPGGALKAMAGGGGAGGGGPLGALCGKRSDHGLYEHAAEEIANESLTNTEESLVLRVCLYCAQDLPSGNVYCALRLGNQAAVRTPTLPGTSNPVWKFVEDIPFKFSGSHTPSCLLEIYHETGFVDQCISAANLAVPSKPTSGPQLSVLNLQTGSGMCKPHVEGRLTVVYQVCNSAEGQPDLLSVAEMDQEAFVKYDYTVSVETLRVKLKRPQTWANHVMVSVELVDLTNDKSHSRKNTSEAVALEETSKKGAFDTANFGVGKDWHQGWESAWTLPESRVGLMSYALRIELWLGEFGARHKYLGSWQEMLDVVLEEVDQYDRTLLRWAVVASAEGGGVAGQILLEIDAYKLAPHRTEMSHESIEDLPRVKGLLPKEERDKEVMYYAWIWGDCFPASLRNSKFCSFVRISMGTSSVESATQGGTRKVVWETPIEIKTTNGCRKAKIELFFQDMDLAKGLKQVGETTITSLEIDVPHWLHFFGGALDAPSSQADEALQMVMGAIRPPSTYTGSLCIMFSTKPHLKSNYFTSIGKCFRKRLLRVRLHRGLILEGYEDRKVNVLVQAPSALLPIHRSSRKSARETLDTEHGSVNRCLLSFPGEVDKDGVLTFHPGRTPDESYASCLKKPANPHAGKKFAWVERRTPAQFPLEILPEVDQVYLYVQMVGEESQPPRIFGTLRLHEPSVGANLNSNVDQIDEEDPAITQGSPLKPKWAKLCMDRSAASFPKTAYFSHYNAGWILGLATLEDASPKEQADELRADKVCGISGGEFREVTQGSEPQVVKYSLDPKTMLPDPMSASPSMSCFQSSKMVHLGSPGDLVRYEERLPEDVHTVYCHIDLLAARQLPAMDEDGLSDPCFEVRVEGTRARKHHGLPKSLNPTYMLRAQIPIDLWIPARPGHPSFDSKLPQVLEEPLPPVSLVMLDQDTDSKSGASTFDEIGTIHVKDPINLDWHENDLGAPGPNQYEVDVNTLHKAEWHALDAPVSSHFDPYDAQGTPKSLRGRPRVLLAAGYSIREASQEKPPLSPNLTPRGPKADGLGPIQNSTKDIVLCSPSETSGYFTPLTAGTSSFYSIQIDLLGLRNLLPTCTHPELLILSFWDGRCLIDIEDRELPNPNFHAYKPPDDWREFAATVSNIMRIVEPDHERGEISLRKENKEQDDDDNESLATTVGLDEFVGVRITPPLYEAPIIPYLQVQPDSQVRTSSKGHGETIAPGGPIVVLPDVSFVLRSRMGMGDHGSLSIPLTPFLQDTSEGSERKISAVQKASLTFHNLPEMYQKLCPMTNVVAKEEVCTISIDCFAPITGFMSFEQTFRLGRYLQDKHLFRITDEDGDEHRYAFNLNDNLQNNVALEDKPFDETVSPTLYVDRKNTRPCSPKELFQAYLSKRECATKSPDKVVKRKVHSQEGAVSVVLHKNSEENPEPMIDSPDDIMRLTCRTLRRKARADGWRSISHQHAPAPMDSKNCEPALQKNLHTFIVPAGHIIKKDDRLSKLLGRFQLYVAPEEEREKGDICPTSNFMVIQFNVPGTVIWSPPETVSTFPRTGDILFVVRLHDMEETLCYIPVPSFDMRYPNETAYYPRKTLVKRWKGLEERVEAYELLQKAKGKERQKHLRAQKQQEAIDAQANGYSLPIPVQENEFVVRLRKKASGLCFDRVQTDGWYLTVLGEVFPSIRKAAENAESHSAIHQAAKDQYLKEYLNLRQDLQVGEKGTSVGMIKGVVTVNAVNQKDALNANSLAHLAGHENTQVDGVLEDTANEVSSDLPLVTPIEQIWQVDSVTAHVFLLTVHGISAPSTEDLTVSVGVVGSHMAKCYSEQTPCHAPNLTLYQHWETTAQLPGQATLRIEILDKKGRAIASGDVDLEDRWLALTQRKASCLTDTDYLYSHTSVPKDCNVEDEDEGTRRHLDGSHAEFLTPELSPFSPLPIEFKKLIGHDKDTGYEIPMGMLRFWLDLIPAGTPYEGDVVAVHASEFQVRVVVWNVTGIGIWKDKEERNDLYVKGFVQTKRDGKTMQQMFKTDTHKLSNTEANFNWRWVFDITTPVDACGLTVSLHDDDETPEDEPLYNPVTIALDQLIRLAMHRQRSGRSRIGVNREVVRFDSWPESREASASRSKAAFHLAPTTAILRLDVECIPKAEAEKNKVGHGRDAPQPLPPPKLRVSTDKPVDYVKAHIGPRKRRMMIAACGCFACTIIFLNVILIIITLAGTGK